MPAGTDIDAELEAVKALLLSHDPKGTRIARVLRDTFDQLYDGQRTGRYRVEQLYKTEKTHFGTLVEINLHREFKFEDGQEMDYRIAGCEVDCKYSQTNGGWMIPPEAQGRLCLVVWAEDSAHPKWSVGLVRVTPDRLNSGGNRDNKATLNMRGRNAITWLFKEAELPPNILLQLDQAIVTKIFAARSGQKRINELFRNTLGMRVGRAVVATVAKQDDYMKRVRSNGGARTALQPEGIVILGQYSADGAIARALDVPVPEPGESVSVRLTPATGRGPGVVRIGEGFWRIAATSDPITPAPTLPRN